MPDSLMSWGHSSMISNVKRLFKKGPLSPSSKDKQSSSADNSSKGLSSYESSSNGHSNSRGPSGTHSSNGHSSKGRESVSNGHSGSRGTCQLRKYLPNGQAGGHPSPQNSFSSNGHSSINQLFPTSPRATGFEDFYAARSMSPRPGSPARSKGSKSGAKPATDPLLKAMQVLGATKDELCDYTKSDVGECSGSPDDGYDSCTSDDTGDEESYVDDQPIYIKSEIPSSFEFHRPAKVIQDVADLSEARTSPRKNSELELRKASFQFGQMSVAPGASIKSGEDVLLETHEPVPTPTISTTTLLTMRSLPEQFFGHVSNGHMSPGGNRTAGGSSRPSREFSVDNRRIPSPPQNEVNRYPAQSHSPRSNVKLSNGPQSPRSQCSPRGTTWAQNGSHSPEGRSWGSSSSARGRQEGSWGSNGSASPQWGYNGYPSPDGGLRSDRICIQGHPLPAPPPSSSPQHPLYVPTAGRSAIHVESPRQVALRERSAQGFGHRVNSPSSQHVPPRMTRILSPVVSPLPSPPRSPLPSPRPLTLPFSPRSPLPAPPQPLSRYPSPPRSPSRAPRIPTKWAKIRQIGTGSFGTVHEAMNLDDGSFFAVKISRGETITPEIQKEIEVLSYLKHPNVVQYFGTGQEDGHMCIFLELMQNSLQSIIKHFQLMNCTIDETLISTYTRQILQGLEYLHKTNTIHRDIKCANILVDKDGQVKLADFGLAKEVGQLNPATSCKGTPYFMAPEILKPDKTEKKGYGLPVDIWSLGCTVLEMADGKPPWSGTTGFSWFFLLFKGELPPIPQHLSPACVDFIKKCLQFKPEDRPTASDLLRHPFVANAPTTVASAATMISSYRLRSVPESPPPAAVWRNGPHSDQAQSRSSGFTQPATVQKSTGFPPSPDNRPKLQRCHRLERTLSRSYSNPCIDTRELQEAIHAPRTPPPASTTSDYGRNYHAW
ncbi:protein MpMAPKKK25 [Marchantia polymorpha subsp. ruderalis]|uniref:mitogen-activated protein kinase kinase kinase n=1 Tax=Marchantia polymorpha TaxID=3197 RepID=A0A2R6X854_MARPO|nr:hypothetical protein MARPO_0030s0030 [Marchantia polymorpha]BBN20169.1 hypothetical protein Mp_8g16980 [Marchantia polymorpha subsp. ruderalis]|eukprot:PTQ42284.1 hypothetical protein MARPO_0030s0030 [Marchantia polymorpha]